MEATLAEYLSHAPLFVRTVEGVITHWTQGAEELYGYTWSEAQGRCSHELLRTRFPSPLEDINRALASQGRWQGLLNHTRANGAQIWTESVWRLRTEGDGSGCRVVELNTDVTARQLLSFEVDHRVKNNLAIVQSLARLTLKAANPADFGRFEQRLVALSRAHDLLARTSWKEAGLGDVLASVLASFGVSERARTRGPRVLLTPSSVIAYTLAFHELCTNALKFGALSAEGGGVEVVWELIGTERERIHLIWREFGGPRVAAPSERGFGSALIERIISAEIGEKVFLKFEPAGLVCEFDGPVQKSVSVEGRPLDAEDLLGA